MRTVGPNCWFRGPSNIACRAGNGRTPSSNSTFHTSMSAVLMVSHTVCPPPGTTIKKGTAWATAGGSNEGSLGWFSGEPLPPQMSSAGAGPLAPS
eukprot:7193428-Pyramimonas_sp.AAC.1